jgi:lysophospholipase L1-like esterase
VSTNFTPDGTKANWWILSRIDLWLDDSYGCVAVLGDSITDGRGSTNNSNNRWPDDLAVRLQANPDTVKVGVINQGIGGGAVVKGGLGPTALARYDGDVLGQPGVKWVIIFEGVNDIGGGTDAKSIISAYKTFITKAHAANLLIYGATITPFKGNGYYSTAHEAVRDEVNDWIRTSGQFDGVIDFDLAVRDPADKDQLNPAYQFEWLHLNPAGYQAMAEAIDLNLFKLKKAVSK